jgi:methylated-DNA-protein-cysteine methyltransferase-like protein
MGSGRRAKSANRFSPGGQTIAGEQVRKRYAGAHRRPKLDDRVRSLARDAQSSSFFYRVFALVRKVPRGRVVTYGQIARALGVPRGARTVGWAMRVSPAGVPWHRVVNARGEISLRPSTGCAEQRARLKAEGVRFSRNGKIDLDQYGWGRF